MISKDDVIDKVLEQIKKDVLDEDLTSIEELLNCVPLVNLIGYLPEGIITDEVEEEETFTRT